MLKRAGWKDKQSEGLLDYDRKKWTIGELLKTFINTGGNAVLDSVINPRGQKEQSWWSFIPIKNHHTGFIFVIGVGQ